MGGLFAAILYTANTKTTKKRHGVTQKADDINTILVKHHSAPAACQQSLRTGNSPRQSHAILEVRRRPSQLAGKAKAIKWADWLLRYYTLPT